jgi:hypothetical protein
MHFPLTFQEVIPISKTRNQLTSNAWLCSKVSKFKDLNRAIITKASLKGNVAGTRIIVVLCEEVLQDRTPLINLLGAYLTGYCYVGDYD